MYDTASDEAADLRAPNGCGPLLSPTVNDSKSLRQQIFEFVRAKGSAARADITRSLGISAGSATTLTAELISSGLLREVVDLPRESGRGRPPVALEVVSDARLVIGIKISDERHTAALTDFAGNMIADAALETSPQLKSLTELLDEIANLIALVLRDTGKSLDDISAVGAGLSGIVDHQSGIAAWSPMFTERDIDLRTAFQDRFGLPLYLDNDANVVTLAELWFGAGRTKSDFAVVTIENGVGMGVVLNNRLFRGSRGMGMELGHTKVQLDGALCRCGQRGCLEAYLSDYALAREAATALDRNPRNLQSANAMLESLYAQAKAGNQSARTIFRRAGRYLAVGLSNVVQLFDPDLIILSGDRMQYDYLYADEVMSEMQRLTLSDGRKPCQIEINAWGDLVWARGASALALSAVTDTVLAERP